ncbi:ankyrin repeat domain-containing protein [Paraburkholderia sp. SIMBA_027]|uniref:ankyrin repeat domain-containing protein n=1 Tax=Paraburkholderia sp. SIMBA_027 TaxID=3085770 RepID=UPI00397B389E
MSLHAENVPVTCVTRFTRESASCRASPPADANPRQSASAALAAWLSGHDFPDVHSRGIDGVTPLMLAALHGEDSLVDALLDAGARFGALDDEGNHALWYACLAGAPAPILRLIEAGIEIDHANDHDITCLMQAAASGRVEVMHLLLSLGASEGLYAPDGRDALDMAADRGFELLRTARRLGDAKPGAQGIEAGRAAIAADAFTDKAA